jgi:hypothetical protein
MENITRPIAAGVVCGEVSLSIASVGWKFNLQVVSILLNGSIKVIEWLPAINPNTIAAKRRIPMAVNVGFMVLPSLPFINPVFIPSGAFCRDINLIAGNATDADRPAENIADHAVTT